MNNRIINATISIGIFCALFYGTFVLFPYVTSTNYVGSENVSGFFPIAIIENGQVKVVRWREYQQNPAAYKGKLFSVPSEKQFELSPHVHCTLKSGENDSLALSLYEDDYTFWAEYSLKNGIVKPISLRIVGAFVVFYCFLFGFVGTPIVNCLIRKIRIRIARTEA